MFVSSKLAAGTTRVINQAVLLSLKQSTHSHLSLVSFFFFFHDGHGKEHSSEAILRYMLLFLNGGINIGIFLADLITDRTLASLSIEKYPISLSG